MTDLSPEQSGWLKKQRIRIEDKQKGQYLHFDSRIKKISEGLARECSSPDYAVEHFYYPFIREVKIERRYADDRKTIEKKLRPIIYAGHKDALIFSWYGFILEKLYEDKITELKLDKNVIAYRSLGKSNDEFAKEVIDFIKMGSCCVICLDVKGFFDNLDHGIIKDEWRKLLTLESLPKDHYRIYKGITKYDYIDKDTLMNLLKLKKKDLKGLPKFCSDEDFRSTIRGSKLIKKNKTGIGIPQGNPISSVLSNLYMIKFDIAVSEYSKSFNGLYRRYCDDIILVCPIDQYQEVVNKIKELIINQNLKIQDKKTEIRKFIKNSQGSFVCLDEEARPSKLQYLGIETNGSGALIKSKTLSKFQRKLSRAVNGEVGLSRWRRKQIGRKKLNYKFTSSEKPNFLMYAKKVAKTFDSRSIEKQVTRNKIISQIKSKIAKRVKR